MSRPILNLLQHAHKIGLLNAEQLRRAQTLVVTAPGHELDWQTVQRQLIAARIVTSDQARGLGRLAAAATTEEDHLHPTVEASTRRTSKTATRPIHNDRADRTNSDSDQLPQRDSHGLHADHEVTVGDVAMPLTAPERYAFGAELGRGGMGTVVAAVDRLARRTVALKTLITPNPRADQLRRFLREAQITAQLEHPNIVPVHEVARDAEGRPYFTMKWVRGQSLSSRIARLQDDWRMGRGEGSFPLTARLDVFCKICDALAFAHDRSVLHRDLKPDNIMVGEFGEVLVMDWGLARLMASGADRTDPAAEASNLDGVGGTMDGHISGTPAYMSPEQAEGRNSELDARSDVYSLGAMLYELLATVPPFTGGSAVAVIAEVTRGRVVPPSVKAAKTFRPYPRLPIPPELEAITLKAMRCEPSRRYATVAALKADIEAFLANRPVTARVDSWMERLMKWGKRNPARALGLVLSAGFAAVLMMGAGAAWTLIDRAARQAELEQQARREAEIVAAARNGQFEQVSALLGIELAQRRSEAREDYEWLISLMRDSNIDLESTFKNLPPRVTQRLIRSLESIIETSRKSATPFAKTEDLYYLGALYLFTTPDARRARHLFDEVLAQQPGHFRALNGRMHANMRLDDLHAALEDLAGLERLEPKNAMIYINRSAIWGMLNEPKKALDAAATALQLNPKNAAALVNRGHAYEALGDKSRALADYTEALKLEPQHRTARYYRALLHVDLRNGNAAYVDATVMVALDPKNADAFHCRAAALFELGKNAEAREDLAAALALDPKHARALFARGTQRRDDGDLSGAEADFDAAIAAQPTMAVAYLARGDIRASRKNEAGALRDYAEAIRQNPNYAEAFINRAALHFDAGRWAAAKADADRATELRPSIWQAWALASMTRQKLGDPTGAIAAARRGLAACQTDAQRQQLADALYSAGVKLPQ